MLFNLTDVIIICLIIAFGVGGFISGLILSLGSVAGLVLGAWTAGHYFAPVSKLISPYLLGYGAWADIAAFILIFIIVGKLVSLVFFLANKIFHIFAFIPFLKTINRFAGLILGLAEGVLVCILVLYAVSRFGNDIKWLIDNLDKSQVAHWLMDSSKFITALFPEALNKITSIFNAN